MTAFGKPQSVLVVNSLVADGSTNIAEGLWKVARVVSDRQARNLVCSVILLSDGMGSHNLRTAWRRTMHCSSHASSFLGASTMN